MRPETPSTEEPATTSSAATADHSADFYSGIDIAVYVDFGIYYEYRRCSHNLSCDDSTERCEEASRADSDLSYRRDLPAHRSSEGERPG